MYTKKVHFPQITEDTCSRGSEMPVMGGHDRCRGTLVFLLSALFAEGVKLPLKVKNVINVSKVSRFPLFSVNILLFAL